MDETRQLAAEVHDGIGQELAGISLMLTALRRLPQTQYPEVQEPLENIAGLLVQAIVNCRRVSEGFGGFLVRAQGLTAALLHFASQFDDGPIRVEFHGRDIPSHWLDETTAYYMFGIGREAIFNAFRHSRADTIRVTCDYADNTIRMSIEDNGVGLAESSSGHGIGRSIMKFSRPKHRSRAYVQRSADWRLARRVRTLSPDPRVGRIARDRPCGSVIPIATRILDGTKSVSD
jgi:two-component system, NarL family, sensor histidine kinase UhpB